MRLVFSFLLSLLLPFIVFSQTYSKGANVEIKWGTGWYKGKVIDTNGDQFKVTYTGYSSSWDEWVKADRLRTPGTSSKAAASEQPSKVDAPADLPLGKYHAFQNNGGGLSFQYSLLINSYTSYTINGQTGACSYDRASRLIVFTSGKIRGYKGIYRPKSPTNPNDPPTIVIDFNGNTPILNQSHKDNYIYAYLQK